MVVFVCTTEKSGVDRYSKELAKRINAHIVFASRYSLGLKTISLLKTLRNFSELIHFPNQHFGRYLPFLFVDSIITVHDVDRMVFNHEKESIFERIGLFFDRWGIRFAKHIITVSETTKSDLIKYLNIPNERITVIYNGVDHKVFSPKRKNKLFPFRYVLFVGSERPRKNLERIFKAFAMLLKNPQFKDMKLVKIGGPGREISFREDTINFLENIGIKEHCVFLEDVENKDLSKYYTSAEFLIYPSLYEGFGLPILESMASDCPVITSKVSATAEISSKAALLVDPLNIKDIYQGMFNLMIDTDLRQDLIRKGNKLVRQFSWDKTVDETMQLYRNLSK